MLKMVFPEEANGSRVGTPESWDRDADGRTDVTLKKAKEVPV